MFPTILDEHNTSLAEKVAHNLLSISHRIAEMRDQFLELLRWKSYLDAFLTSLVVNISNVEKIFHLLTWEDPVLTLLVLGSLCLLAAPVSLLLHLVPAILSAGLMLYTAGAVVLALPFVVSFFSLTGTSLQVLIEDAVIEHSAFCSDTRRYRCYSHATLNERS